MISAVYDALVTAHVVFAVIGFASVAFSGVYGALARRSVHTEGSEREEVTRYFDSRLWAEWFIVPVPLLGAIALAAKPHGGDFSEAWVVIGILLWAFATALLFAVVRPAEARIRASRDIDSSGKTLMWAALVSDVLFVLALAVMVTQPR